MNNRQDSNLQVEGQIRVNGKRTDRNMRSYTAYIQQHDMFVGMLTVREHLVTQVCFIVTLNTLNLIKDGNN